MQTGFNTGRTVEEMTDVRESVTKLYAPAAPRESFPSLATQLEPPPPRSTTSSRVIATRSFRRPAIGLLVGASCVLVGIAIGTTIAASGSRGVAAAATAPSAPAPAPVVTPIEPLVAPPPVAAAVPAAVPAAATDTVTATDTATATAKPSAPRHHRHRAHHVAATVAAPAPSGSDGTLAVSSKPPCKISIDGHDTGLFAPQRSITLAPGHHRVTLSNPDQGIQLTTDVKVTAEHTTKLIRDFTN